MPNRRLLAAGLLFAIVGNVVIIAGGYGVWVGNAVAVAVCAMALVVVLTRLPR